jgi:hypothetical protein
MSIGSLLLKVRDKLRIEFKDIVPSPTHNIRIGLSGQPIATAGEIYIAVHLRDWSNPEPGITSMLKDEIGLLVTTTIRSRKYPEDRDPDEVLVKAVKGLTDISDVIRASLHGNNTLSSSAGRIEPLKWITCIGPSPQLKDWYRSNDPFDGDMQPAGYSMEVVFTGGLRTVAIPC